MNTRAQTETFIDGKLTGNNRSISFTIHREVLKRVLADSYNLMDNDSDDIREGSKKFFSTALARGAISVANNGNASYDPDTGILTVNDQSGGGGGSFSPTAANIYDAVKDIIVGGTDDDANHQITIPAPFFSTGDTQTSELADDSFMYLTTSTNAKRKISVAHMKVALGGGGTPQPAQAEITAFMMNGLTPEDGSINGDSVTITYQVENPDDISGTNLTLQISTNNGTSYSTATGFPTLPKTSTSVTGTVSYSGTLAAGSTWIFRLVGTRDDNSQAVSNTVTVSRAAAHEIMYYGSDADGSWTGWQPSAAAGSADVTAVGTQVASEPTGSPRGVLVQNGEYFYFASPTNRPITSIRYGSAVGRESRSHFTQINNAFTIGSQQYEVWYAHNLGGGPAYYNYFATVGSA